MSSQGKHAGCKRTASSEQICPAPPAHSSFGAQGRKQLRRWSAYGRCGSCSFHAEVSVFGADSGGGAFFRLGAGTARADAGRGECALSSLLCDALRSGIGRDTLLSDGSSRWRDPPPLVAACVAAARNAWCAGPPLPPRLALPRWDEPTPAFATLDAVWIIRSTFVADERAACSRRPKVVRTTL